MGGFQGLDRDAVSFYAELRAANTKTWWTANKARYNSAVREPFEALGAELEPEFGAVKIFRPYRDVRFSADKTPYKLHIGMLTQTTVKHYLQLSEDGLMLGGGMYELPSAALARFREAVDDPRSAEDLDELLAELGSAGFELLRDDALKTAPRGYRADHPRLPLLQLKRLAVGRREPPADWMWTPDAYDVIADHWRTVSTWCAWLTETLAAELLDAAQPSGRGRSDAM
ncbi:DUF2461 domain-containing protein [Micromonospora sp. DT81.3]|uniref:DUF2461 domain-containing protein n=1 Tax=Micromonospora sp. DT81.3 TaxID=3416523 RepID=UPI003CEE5A05